MNLIEFKHFVKVLGMLGTPMNITQKLFVYAAIWVMFLTPVAFLIFAISKVVL